MSTSATYLLLLESLLLLICAHIIQFVRNRRRYMHIPLVGAKSIFEPRITATWRFFKNAKSIVDTGYINASPMMIPNTGYRELKMPSSQIKRTDFYEMTQT